MSAQYYKGVVGANRLVFNGGLTSRTITVNRAGVAPPRMPGGNRRNLALGYGGVDTFTSFWFVGMFPERHARAP